MKLYYHPRSTYCHKVLLAMYEKQVDHTAILLYPGDAKDRARLLELTPLAKVPLLVLDSGWKIPESTTIVEYIDAHHATGPRLIPEDRDLGRQTRFHDRISDLYITESYATIARDSDAGRVTQARERLDAIFAGLDNHLANREWVMGETFTLADCALAPVLLDRATVHSFERFKNVSAYAERASRRASVARVRRELAAFEARAAS